MLTVFLTKIKNAWRKYQHYKHVRSTINELNKLSDRELKDIGINRGMISSIAMESIYDNRLA